MLLYDQCPLKPPKDTEGVEQKKTITFIQSWAVIFVNPFEIRFFNPVRIVTPNFEAISCHIIAYAARVLNIVTVIPGIQNLRVKIYIKF